MSKASRLLIGLGLSFALLGLAGFLLHSFSYPLALVLAVLFGIAGVLSSWARSARQTWVLFGITTVVASLATYLWVVGGGIGLGGVGPPRVAPTGTPELRGSCTKQTATRLVEDFFVKWNDRDVGGVARLFGSGVSFHDNVAGQQTMFVGQEALRRYLTDRFALDDRFSDVIAAIPENPSPASANPTVSFVRRVGTVTYRGNAKLVCADDVLRDVVMSAE
jgi:hypothetical protein